MPEPETSEDAYLIWSHEHRSWWGPGGCGYVRQMSRAGRYTREDALFVCVRAVPGTADRLGALPELPVRLEDAEAVLAGYRAEYPISGDWA
jgi:hypothetical protein